MSPVATIREWASRGRRLAVASAGTTVREEGTGEPVVCLHGVPSSAFLYRKVLPELAARNRRGIAFDLPRLGLADRPEHFDLRAYVHLLKREDGGRAFLRIMRGFERTRAFERRILQALSARGFPAQVLWGDKDPALRVERHGEQAREALGVDAITRLHGKHFVPEDAPAEIAEQVARLGGPGGSTTPSHHGTPTTVAGAPEPTP